MECPSLLDILGFLQLPDENIDLISNTNSNETQNTINQNLEKKREKYKTETESTESGNIMSGGSAQGDSTQIKIITLGSKKFIYKNNYAAKRKSAKRK